jgi:hypothetical protein
MTGEELSKQAKGGNARAKSLGPTKRSEIAKKAAETRWAREAAVEVAHDDELLAPLPTMPIAKWRGPLNIIGVQVPCYVLDNGVRVIGRTSATELLTSIKGGGALEKYLAVRALARISHTM